MPIYNKLVRDKIPQIIKASGKSPTTKILNEKEYITELRKKSQEELQVSTFWKRFKGSGWLHLIMLASMMKPIIHN